MLCSAHYLGWTKAVRPVSRGRVSLSTGVRELVYQATAAGKGTLTGVEVLHLLRQGGVKLLTSRKGSARATSPGVEVLVRLDRDTLFGPVLSLSLGRMAREIWEDVSYRVVPLTRRDAQQMVQEVKGHRLLDGSLGGAVGGIPHLVELLFQLSALTEQAPEIGELELSPAYVSARGVVVGDARVVLTAAQPAV